MALLGEFSSQELLQGQLHLWNQSLGVYKSVALAVALELQIPDAIYRLGGAATLPQILAEAGISSSRLDGLRRVLRVLTVSDIFTVSDDNSVYKLTPASRLLVTSTGGPLLSYVDLLLVTCRDSRPGKGLRAWFQQQMVAGDLLSPFALASVDGQDFWKRAEQGGAAFPFDEAMASDTAFLMPIVLKECGDQVFRGLTSLVDVAGGLGGASATIAAAFPGLKCTVLDLPHVVAKAPTGTKVQYVAGDMFESIPPANAVFLKWVFHDWSDDKCVKILNNCKRAIPPRDAGGKVIIIDMVIGSGGSADVKHVETQVLFDLMIMGLNGVERDEQEWKKIFLEAGFKDYKIIPVLGLRSIIELYP